MNINSFFEKIYYINLKRSKERNDYMIEQLKRFNIKAERFEAIDGIHIDINNYDTKLKKKTALGCLLSHETILKEVYNNNFKNVLIMEDDIKLVDNFNEIFNSYIKKIPYDWDIFYFSINHSLEYGYPTRIDDGYELKNKNDKTHGIFKVKRGLTTGMYAVNKKIIKKILDELDDKKYEIDLIYADIQKECNCFCIRPHLATQKPGFSFIDNKYMDNTIYLE